MRGGELRTCAVLPVVRESLTVAEKFIGDAVMAVFGASGRCGEAKALREGQAIFAKLGASPVVAQAA